MQFACKTSVCTLEMPEKAVFAFQDEDEVSDVKIIRT